MIRRFPIIFDGFTSAVDRLRNVVVALLGETVIYAFPDPAEALRPNEQYTSLQTLQDIGIGQPQYTARALSVTSPLPSTPDVRKIVHQLRETLVRATMFGPEAMDRAIRLSLGYTSSAAKALWVDCALQQKSQVKDSTRLVGNHWEPVAHVDFVVRYVAQLSDDIYSIQTTVCPVTVT